MPEDTGGEKSLPPSQRKLEKAREKGNVAKSQDLGAAWTLLTALVVFHLFGRHMLAGMVSAGRYYFGGAGTLEVEARTMQELVYNALAHLASFLLPALLVLMISGIVINLVQVGFLIAPSALAPNLNKLNPITGFKKFVSMRSFVELVKSVLKLVLISYIVYLTLRSRVDEIMGVAILSPIGIVGALSGLIGTLWLRIVLVMLAIGLLDYAFQRWQYMDEMRMTVQEAKEELKEVEGDPRVRQRIRQIQRRLAMQRMMREVPAADVVITNPTTYAVALRYNPNEMAAPTVVAKGARLVAERIREIAVENDVPIVEKPELARTLYRTIEIGHPVPEQLFRAVAEVLAFVYEIDRRADKMRERAEMVHGGARARAAG